MRLRLFLVYIFICLAWAASAQGSLAVTLHSNVYDTYGEESTFTLAIGSTVPGTLGVDFGEGIVEYPVAPATLDAPTYISCPATPEGNVSIYTYGDALIDYFDGSGCDITDITFHRPEVIEILSLRHNSLHALDLSDMAALASVDVGDNPFDVTPLIVGPDKPVLMILNIDEIEHLDSSFSLSDYPSLVSFDAFDTKDLAVCDPSGCPQLKKLSIDETSVSQLDLSGNPELLILNVAGTLIPSIDVTCCPKLQQLFCSAMGSSEQSERMTYLDVSACPDLVYLFAASNALVDIDLSHNPLLQDISLGHNYLTEIDLSANTRLANVAIDYNYFTYATLPSDPGWLSYSYKQHPIELPESYLVGTPIDLSYALLRPGTVTTAELLLVDSSNPMGETVLDPSCFSFSDGVLTVNEVIAGQVFARFYNDEFTLYPLTTTAFKVKSPDEYGKHEFAFSMSLAEESTAQTVSLSIGLDGASQARPRHFYVDLGDGNLIEVEAFSSELPAEPNFVHAKDAPGPIKVYVEEDVPLTALGCSGIALSDIDLSRLSDLQTLSLTGTGLSAIDLRYNYLLQSLTLTGNHFADGFTLIGENGFFNKNLLTYIDLSDNELTKIDLFQPSAFEFLDLSHNSLDEINLTDGERIAYLDLSYNLLEYVRLSYQSSMKHFDGSHNRLSQIVMPETNVIEWFDISHNDFSFSSLPVPGEGTGSTYSYAPQAVIPIPLKGMGCDLSQMLCTVNGHATVYRWVDAEGAELAPGVDYTIEDGVTRFLDASIGRTVHCEMTNAAFPDLVISTTEMLSAGMPQYVVGTFTTPQGRQKVNITLGAAQDGSSVYIDWSGDGNATEYLLKTTYTVFSNAVTTAGAQVRVLSYEPESDLTIFSINGVKMDDVDLSGMTQLQCLSIANAGIGSLVMPASESLTELSLINDKFTEFDFSPYPYLQMISFEGNLLKSVDLTPLPKLQLINFSNNALESVFFGNHPDLWAVHLTNNKLTEIDLSSLPSVYQTTLDHNLLTSVCVDGLSDLHVLYLDHNCLDFNSLPLPRDQWTVYYYSSQASLAVEPVDGVVDLSSQYMIHGTPSEYTWLKGEPWIDEDTGELMGYLLNEGDDYGISDGITTFYVDVPDAVGIVTNELFPQAYLTTAPLDIKAAGISQPEAPHALIYVSDAKVHVSAAPGTLVNIFTPTGILLCSGKCDLSGTFSSLRLPQGPFIVTAGTVVKKVVISPPTP